MNDGYPEQIKETKGIWSKLLSTISAMGSKSAPATENIIIDELPNADSDNIIRSFSKFAEQVMINSASEKRPANDPNIFSSPQFYEVGFIRRPDTINLIDEGLYYASTAALLYFTAKIVFKILATMSTLSREKLANTSITALFMSMMATPFLTPETLSMSSQYEEPDETTREMEQDETTGENFVSEPMSSQAAGAQDLSPDYFLKNILTASDEMIKVMNEDTTYETKRDKFHELGRERLVKLYGKTSADMRRNSDKTLSHDLSAAKNIPDDVASILKRVISGHRLGEHVDVDSITPQSQYESVSITKRMRVLNDTLSEENIQAAEFLKANTQTLLQLEEEAKEALEVEIISLGTKEVYMVYDVNTNKYHFDETLSTKEEARSIRRIRRIEKGIHVLQCLNTANTYPNTEVGKYLKESCIDIQLALADALVPRKAIIEDDTESFEADQQKVILDNEQLQRYWTPGLTADVYVQPEREKSIESIVEYDKADRFGGDNEIDEAEIARVKAEIDEAMSDETAEIDGAMRDEAAEIDGAMRDEAAEIDGAAEIDEVAEIDENVMRNWDAELPGDYEYTEVEKYEIPTYDNPSPNWEANAEELRNPTKKKTAYEASRAALYKGAKFLYELPKNVANVVYSNYDIIGSLVLPILIAHNLDSPPFVTNFLSVIGYSYAASNLISANRRPSEALFAGLMYYFINPKIIQFNWMYGLWRGVRSKRFDPYAVLPVIDSALAVSVAALGTATGKITPSFLKTLIGSAVSNTPIRVAKNFFKGLFKMIATIFTIITPFYSMGGIFGTFMSSAVTIVLTHTLGYTIPDNGDTIGGSKIVMDFVKSFVGILQSGGDLAYQGLNEYGTPAAEFLNEYGTPAAEFLSAAALPLYTYLVTNGNIVMETVIPGSPNMINSGYEYVKNLSVLPSITEAAATLTGIVSGASITVAAGSVAFGVILLDYLTSFGNALHATMLTAMGNISQMSGLDSLFFANITKLGSENIPPNQENEKFSWFGQPYTKSNATTNNGTGDSSGGGSGGAPDGDAQTVNLPYGNKPPGWLDWLSSRDDETTKTTAVPLTEASGGGSIFGETADAVYARAYNVASNIGETIGETIGSGLGGGSPPEAGTDTMNETSSAPPATWLAMALTTFQSLFSGTASMFGMVPYVVWMIIALVVSMVVMSLIAKGVFFTPAAVSKPLITTDGLTVNSFYEWYESLHQRFEFQQEWVTQYIEKRVNFQELGVLLSAIETSTLFPSYYKNMNTWLNFMKTDGILTSTQFWANTINNDRQEAINLVKRFEAESTMKDAIADINSLFTSIEVALIEQIIAVT